MQGPLLSTKMNTALEWWVSMRSHLVSSAKACEANSCIQPIPGNDIWIMGLFIPPFCALQIEEIHS